MGDAGFCDAQKERKSERKMSQKAVRRSRRHTEEEDEIKQEIKNSVNAKTKDVKDVSNNETETNGGVQEQNGLSEEKRVIQTRSRSNTPMKKNSENTKTNHESDSAQENESFSISIDDESSKSLNGSKDEPTEEKSSGDGNSSLKNENDDGKEVLSEAIPTESEITAAEKDEEENENIPELQYDENDIEVESEGSPSRCKTRRSDTRTISTPKTPKLLEEDVKVLYVPMERLPEDTGSDRSTPRNTAASPVESNNDSETQQEDVVDLDNSDSISSISMDNISTRAVAGSDATRGMDMTYQDSTLLDDNSMSSPMINPNRSLSETLRSLSSRRTIRPLSNDYRKIALRKNLESKETNIYVGCESVEKIMYGIKRKNRSSITPEGDVKRIKKETGLFSYIWSPIFSHFKSKSGTPKLITYEKKNNAYAEPLESNVEIQNGGEQQKKGCSIM